MKPSLRKCLLRRIACQNALKYAELTLPEELAVPGAVVELGTDRWQVVVAAQHPIKPAVRQEVIDYLLAQA
jgi:hypothetical protein